MARASAERLPARSSLARALMSGTLGGVMAWVYTARAARARGPVRRTRLSTRLLLLRIALRARAAEDALAFRRQIGLQRLPGHEGDILAFDIGADGVGRIV